VARGRVPFVSVKCDAGLGAKCFKDNQTKIRQCHVHETLLYVHVSFASIVVICVHCHRTDLPVSHYITEMWMVGTSQK
jgi:hypothetical protein